MERVRNAYAGLAGWLCNRRHTPSGMEACHVIRVCMMMGMRWLGCPGVVRGEVLAWKEAVTVVEGLVRYSGDGVGYIGRYPLALSGLGLGWSWLVAMAAAAMLLWGYKGRDMI